MKIADALQGVRRLYIETSPLIYYIETHPTYIKRMDAMMEAVKNTPIEAVCSVMTLTEVLPMPLRQGHPQLVRAYRRILLYSPEFLLLDLTRSMGQIGADLRARYQLKTPDALHVATAIDAGCDAFLTNDLGIKRVTEIPILVLDELTLI